LLHTQVGKKESKVIVKALRNCKTGYAKQVLDYMVSASGKKDISGNKIRERIS